MRELSITDDKVSGHIEARLVVEVKASPRPGRLRVALDLGVHLRGRNRAALLRQAYHVGEAVLAEGAGKS